MKRLLLPVTLIAAFASAASAVAQGVDRVPQDFPTIQAAITLGTAPIVAVSPGRWAGATVTRSVIVRGDNATINVGVPLGPVGVGLVLPPAATGSTIKGFTFDCSGPQMDIGIMSSSTRTLGTASDITIQQNVFTGCAQGITNSGLPTICQPPAVTGGDRWLIEHNQFGDTPARFDVGFTGGGLGVFLYNVMRNSVLQNRFRGANPGDPLFSTASIFTAGCLDCYVNQNDFVVSGANFYFAIANFGNFQPGAAASRNLVIANNDARKDAAPYFGVNYASYDSFVVPMQGNFGTTLIDHAFCGDGQDDFYATTNRSSKVIPPNTAVSRPYADPFK